eukprot:GHVT01041636.1.p1 GENE.GHVT01041636.1~~GHVT01041636.1.p1  ORF type:complete len:103 (+),score=15.49 GHVT01041636.1:405-713(+)
MSPLPSRQAGRGSLRVRFPLVYAPLQLSPGRRGGEGGRRCVVVFVAGGITFSEMRSAYEICAEFKDVDVYIGGTSILTPRNVIRMFQLQGEADEQASSNSID